MESNYPFDENEEDNGEQLKDGDSLDDLRNKNKIGLLVESVRRRFQSKDIGRQFWMPDSTSINCFDCAIKFTTIRRRHHCRICGQIFCSNCCNEMIDSKLVVSEDSPKTSSGLLRVCKYCFNKLQNIAVEKSKNKQPRQTSSLSSSGKSFTPSPIRKKSTIGRKLSASSIGDSAVRFAKSTFDNSGAITIERKASLPVKGFRPNSSASGTYDSRLLDVESETSSILSCSFDDVRAMLDELDETIDAREPNWVKEIVEEARLRQAKIGSNEDKEGNNDDNNSIPVQPDGNGQNAPCLVVSEIRPKNEEIDGAAIGQLENPVKETCQKIVKYEPLVATNIANRHFHDKASSRKILFNNTWVDLEKFFHKSQTFFLGENSKNLNDKNFQNVINFPIEIQKSDLAIRVINAIYQRHSEQILQQLLKDELMSMDWLPVLNNIAKQIADNIKLPQYSYLYSIDNYYQNNPESSIATQSNENFPYLMDIRKRVKIKSILNGTKTDCTIINGLVFNKNVAHKKMRTSIDQPRILLFACAISYDERRRSQADFKLTLFDSMCLQESNYIANLVAKIHSLKPDVIFSQGTVCQTALELLREKDITVVLNVKRSILDRIAFFTNAELIHSQEMILNTTKVGKCGKFRLQEFVQSTNNDHLVAGSNHRKRIHFKNRKTLLFLEGCLENIGCSVILRGSSKLEDYKKLKNILRFMIFVHYNHRLEKAFHQSLNCMPIDHRLECETFAQFYQKIIPATSTSPLNNLNNPSNDDNHANMPNQINQISALTTIEDFSDPLRSALNLADEDSNPEFGAKGHENSDLKRMQIFSEKLSEILSILPLSCSPLIQFDMPLLMHKNIHQISSLRFYFPVNLLKSVRLEREVLHAMDGDRNRGELKDRLEDQDENDDDANYAFLFNQKNDPEKYKTSKLLFLKLLTSRYMVIKPHPFLVNDDYDFKLKSQQFIADFRAWGPYLRYIPDFFQRKTENSSPFDQAIEPLSITEQQNISVLFSVFALQAENSFNYCFKPKIFDIHYYGQNDMSLGSFLIRHFFFRQSRFNQSSPPSNPGGSGHPESLDQVMLNMNIGRKVFCPNENCNISMFKHLMRFTHSQGTITIYLNKLNESGHVAMPHKILTWAFCAKCQTISEYTEMSSDSLAISFGKFLELKFYGNRHFNYQKFFIDDLKNDGSDPSCSASPTMPCRHSLHKESYQFFSYDQLVIIFKYEPIGLYEIVTPAPYTPITKNHFDKSKMIDDLKLLTEQCHEVFSRIRNELEKLKSSALKQGSNTNQLFPNMNLETVNIAKLDEFLSILQQEEADFVGKIKEIHYKLSVPELEDYNVLECFNLENNVVFIKKFIAETVIVWNERIKEFFQDVQRKRSSDNKFISNLMNRFLSNDTSATNETNTKPETKTQPDVVSNSSSSVLLDENLSLLSGESVNLDETLLESTGNDSNNNNESRSPNKLSKMISKVAPKMMVSTDNENNNNNSSATSFTSKIFTRNADETVPIVIEMPFTNENVQKQNQMFEHYQLPTFRNLSIIVRDRDPGSIISYSLTTPEYERQLNVLRAQMTKLSATEPSNLEHRETRDPDRSSSSSNNNNESTMAIKNESSADLNQAPNTSMKEDEVNPHIDIQFNDANGKFYCLIYFAELFRKFRSLILVDGGRSARKAIRDYAVSKPLTMADVDDVDGGGGGCGSSSGDDLYIYSLANCIPWNAVGGKSGSTFLKTRDQRFILKEVSKGELKHFLTFVSDYLNYCERALLEKCPSAFVKVVGVYQISYKNTVNNKGSIHYILVMENLFYECNVSFIYDLKGSMRNRKVDIASTYANKVVNNSQDDGNDPAKLVDEDATLNLNNRNQPSTSSSSLSSSQAATSSSTVLLDENLRQISIAYPLYVHVHSKIFLMESIHRDSEFLKNHGVMDYSLLVGFDDEHNEFVVGIIDYVRLFNWEKSLESRVKKITNAIDPTVVHPFVYQKRFLDAINDYFTQVPDKWYPFLQLIPLAGMFRPEDQQQQQQKLNHGNNYNNNPQNPRAQNDKNSSDFVFL